MDAPNIVVSAVKKAEDGDDLIVRCYETEGRSTTATLNLALVNRRWTGTFRALEIKTLRVPRGARRNSRSQCARAVTACRARQEEHDEQFNSGRGNHAGGCLGPHEWHFYAAHALPGTVVVGKRVVSVYRCRACVVMPVVDIHSRRSSHPLAVLSAAPAALRRLPSSPGFTWGFGAVMFGQGVSALGISMGNTLVLAISASLGSFLPILILAPERFRQPTG